MCHTQGLEVVGHRPEVPGHGREGPDLGDEFPGFQAATYGHGDDFLMDVETGYLGKDGVPSELLRRRASEDVARRDILLRVLPGGPGATIPGPGRRPGQTGGRARGLSWSNGLRPDTHLRDSGLLKFDSIFIIPGAA
jgi:hypothetical protein